MLGPQLSPDGYPTPYCLSSYYCPTPFDLLSSPLPPIVLPPHIYRRTTYCLSSYPYHLSAYPLLPIILCIPYCVR